MKTPKMRKQAQLYRNYVWFEVKVYVVHTSTGKGELAT